MEAFRENGGIPGGWRHSRGIEEAGKMEAGRKDGDSLEG